MSTSGWFTHWQRSFDYMEVIARTRARGIWPERLRRCPPFSKVLLVRRDRFGDMMTSLPFIGRALDSGASVKVLATDRVARDLLQSAGVDCVPDPSSLGGWMPEAVLFLERCRHLRSARHPERWQYVETTLRAFSGAHFVVPAMRSAESMSYFAGPYCRPFHGATALSLLERFADGLGFLDTARPLLRHLIADPAARAKGDVVFNLSAGAPGISDSRAIPAGFWADVAGHLPPSLPLSCIFQPGDEARQRSFAEAGEAKKIRPFREVSFPDVADAAKWLGRQRLLVSPQTGLCHLARNLELPTVVLTPKHLAPYWYPKSPYLRRVFADRLADCSPLETAARAMELLGEIS